MNADFAEAAAGRGQDELYMMAKTMLATPETSMKEYIEAEQAAERLTDGFADYFQRYDALITPVQPLPAQKKSTTEFLINGQIVDATYLQGSTVRQLNWPAGFDDAVRYQPRPHADRHPVGFKVAGRTHDPAPCLIAGVGRCGS